MTQHTLPTGPANGPVSGPGDSGSANAAAGSLLLDAAPAAHASMAASASDLVRGTSRPARTAGSNLSFGGVVRSERIKLLSLRSVKITLILTLVMGIGLAALIGLAGLEMMQSQGGAEAPAAGMQVYLLTVATFAAPFLAMVFGVLGVFAIASEYSSGMILSTLAAAPRRGLVFVAKGLVLAVISAVVALIIAAAGLLIAVLYFPASAAQLGSWEVLSGILGSVVYQVLVALLAFGIATLLRSTAGGISTIVGLIFVLPIGLQLMMMTGWSWIETVAHYLPSQLGGVLGLGVAGESSPSFEIAALAMVIWAVAALIPAAIYFSRRDAK